jgi:hypothetical protein
MKYEAHSCETKTNRSHNSKQIFDIMKIIRYHTASINVNYPPEPTKKCLAREKDTQKKQKKKEKT